MNALALLCIGYCVHHEAVWPSDVHRFQYTLEQIESVREMAYHQRVWMQEQGYSYNYGEWQRLIDAQEWRLLAWGHLQSVKRHVLSMEESTWPVETWLYELRDMIGREAYYRGVLPEPRMRILPEPD